MKLHLHRQVSILALIAMIAAFAGGCSGSPRAEDVERVKQDFLTLRFHSEFSPELKGKSDLEIFELSCTQNRVRCSTALEMLKASDPEFYAKLQPPAGQAATAPAPAAAPER
jgi:hypothetical protein